MYADSPAEATRMELTRTDSVARGDTHDFAMEEVTGASSKLAHALLVRRLKRTDIATAGVFPRSFGL